jgi:DNA-binding transcriptional ArsR family regulator
MIAEEIIKLTNAVYKVTDLFPQKEPLKMAIRKEALNVLFFSVLLLKGFDHKNKGDGLFGIKLLEAYFEVSRKQKWVDERNFDILLREYEKVGEFFKTNIVVKKEHPKKEAVVEKAIKKEETKSEIGAKQIEYEELSDLQLKVLELLQNKGQLKPNEINAYFPKLSPRSVRRELKELREKNIINSSGSGKSIFYQINQYY